MLTNAAIYKHALVVEAIRQGCHLDVQGLSPITPVLFHGPKLWFPPSRSSGGSPTHVTHMQIPAYVVSNHVRQPQFKSTDIPLNICEGITTTTLQKSM